MSGYIQGGLPCIVRGGCGSSDAMAEYSNGYHCFSCGRSQPTQVDTRPAIAKKETTDFSEIYNAATGVINDAESLVWLKKAHISSELIEKYGIRYSRQLNRTLLPVIMNSQLIGLEARSATGLPKYLTYGTKTPYLLFTNGPGNPLVIVEDVLSAIRISEYMNCIALRGTHLRKETLLLIWQLRPTQIIIWLDSDAPGQKAVQNCKTKLEWAAPCSVLSTKKDPKCYGEAELYQYLTTEIT